MSRLQPIPNIQPNGFIPSPFVTTDDVVRQMKDWEAHDKSVDLLTKYPAGPSAYALPSAPQMLTDAVNWLEQPGYSRDVVTPMAGLASYFKRAAEGQTPGALDTFMASMDIPVPGAKAMSALLGSGVLHTVFHGSPHIFDAFKRAKIGTGEGAQAYGHGLYFAESPGVAKSYQSTLTKRGAYAVNGDPVQESLIARYPDVYRAAAESPESLQGLINSFDKRIKLNRAIGVDDLDMIDLLDMADTAESLIGKTVTQPEGAFYKVDIPDEAVGRMLDWDKPLSEQPWLDKGTKEEIIQRVRAEGRKPTIPEIAKVNLSTPGYGDPSGKVFYNDLTTKLGTPDIASRMLSEAGIPGIRYLDQTSRGAGEGTRNLVLFDESLAKILERQ